MALRLSPLALVLALTVPAAAQSADEVFREVDRRQRAVEQQRAEVRMEIEDERGRTRTREMLLLSKQGDDDRGRALVVFTAPADIRGTGLLTVETDRGDEQQLYLPAMRRVQRIAGAGRQERFAGSDFTYEDLSTRDPDDYTSRMASTTDDAFILEAVPKPGVESAYGRILLGIDRERYTILRADYFDEGGRMVKRLRASDFSEVVPGTWQPGRLVMEDLEEGRRTVLTFVDRDSDALLRDDLFTERQLQRGAAGL
ncbi:MAG: outer membrane lipoprotein-sorting protein [Rubricoccaceae bacterium]|nr:outer membrane lipoprotein-sorting protein [Rubricoccaceae bacterium]